MHLSLLLVFVLVPSVLADDDWEDFTNNLATDLVSYGDPSAENEENEEKKTF
jgi:hypothetical protein